MSLLSHWTPCHRISLLGPTLLTLTRSDTPRGQTVVSCPPAMLKKGLKHHIEKIKRLYLKWVYFRTPTICFLTTGSNTSPQLYSQLISSSNEVSVSSEATPHILSGGFETEEQKALPAVWNCESALTPSVSFFSKLLSFRKVSVSFPRRWSFCQWLPESWVAVNGFNWTLMKGQDASISLWVTINASNRACVLSSTCTAFRKPTSDTVTLNIKSLHFVSFTPWEHNY